MKLPILERLKEGEKFDFFTLADNIEQTEEYWAWWWEERARSGEFSRPETIQDDDSILIDTNGKTTIDLSSHRDLFDKQLFENAEINLLPASEVTRHSFRGALMRVAIKGSVKLPQPQIIFSGGGYGSGKTTILNNLAECKKLPVRMCDLVSADVFRQLIPEFNLIKAVADSRAGLIVHKECVQLAERLFDLLVEAQRSFIFDSSMAYKCETIERINKAKKHGYFLTMIAVLAPTEVALEWAMHRARISRRFPHPDSFTKSHKAFVQVFREYFDSFDEIKILANLGGSRDIELIAEKKVGKMLEILNPEIFNSAPFIPIKG